MTIALTPGEPAGIGPDLVLQLAQAPRQHPWVVIADRAMLEARARLLGVGVSFDENLSCPSTGPGQLTVRHIPLAGPVTAGLLDTRNAEGVLTTLDVTVDGCLSGEFTAMVTGPVQKSVIAEAGFAFTGHTEYLQARTGADDVVMLLVAQELRVALATTHLALRDVPAALTRQLLRRRIEILHRDLKTRFGLGQPCIAVAGLNPHAGERGHLGTEEQTTIAPVCEALRAENFDVHGPLPADTLFAPQARQRFDAVMAMYHDQGLPVIKALGFGTAVNVTLGLPILRTSVDHGTALAIAGSGDADPGSLQAALDLAATMSERAGT